LAAINLFIAKAHESRHWSVVPIIASAWPVEETQVGITVGREKVEVGPFPLGQFVSVGAHEITVVIEVDPPLPVPLLEELPELVEDEAEPVDVVELDSVGDVDDGEPDSEELDGEEPDGEELDDEELDELDDEVVDAEEVTVEEGWLGQVGKVGLV
jgi:hypothetical protein